MSSRIIFCIVCSGFWFVGVLSPLNLLGAFYQFDVHHIYLHAYYFLLCIVGSLLVVDQRRPLTSSILRGFVAGALSGLGAQIIVFLSRPQTADLIRNHGLTSVSSSLFVGIVILGAPLWGMLGALIAVGVQSAERH